MPDNIRKAVGLILLVSLLSVGLCKPLKEYLLIPTQMRVFETQTQAIETSLSVNAQTSESSEAFTVKKDPHEIKVTGKNQVSQNWYMILPDFQLKNKSACSS